MDGESEKCVIVCEVVVLIVGSELVVALWTSIKHRRTLIRTSQLQRVVLHLVVSTAGAFLLDGRTFFELVLANRRLDHGPLELERGGEGVRGGFGHDGDIGKLCNLMSVLDKIVLVKRTPVTEGAAFAGAKKKLTLGVVDGLTLAACYRRRLAGNGIQQVTALVAEY